MGRLKHKGDETMNWPVIILRQAFDKEKIIPSRIIPEGICFWRFSLIKPQVLPGVDKKTVEDHKAFKILILLLD